MLSILSPEIWRKDGARNGCNFIPRGLAARILQEFVRREKSSATTAIEDHLTERQTEILRLVAQGLTYKEVGARLCITERTIKFHRGEIVERLHVKNRAEAVASARRAGLVE